MLRTPVVLYCVTLKHVDLLAMLHTQLNMSVYLLLRSDAMLAATGTGGGEGLGSGCGAGTGAVGAGAGAGAVGAGLGRGWLDRGQGRERLESKTRQD